MYIFLQYFFFTLIAKWFLKKNEVNYFAADLKIRKSVREGRYQKRKSGTSSFSSFKQDKTCACVDFLFQFHPR